jgi:hypothetical protein
MLSEGVGSWDGVKTKVKSRDGERLIRIPEKETVVSGPGKFYGQRLAAP